MLSKVQIKLIKSLSQKKYRKKEGLFVAEGIKVINELLDSHFKLRDLFGVDGVAFAKAHTPITLPELKKISMLATSQQALAVFEIPTAEASQQDGLTVVLDNVRDPGNLGTIIRLCDWFGIEDLVCSLETVDCFNPKVVQATMGSLARVRIHYTNLQDYIKSEGRPIYGTFMDGISIYEEKLPAEGVLIMGNEANGISTALEKGVRHRIAIPQFGITNKTESLNVATATAICLSEFKRRKPTGR